MYTPIFFPQPVGGLLLLNASANSLSESFAVVCMEIGRQGRCQQTTSLNTSLALRPKILQKSMNHYQLLLS